MNGAIGAGKKKKEKRKKRQKHQMPDTSRYPNGDQICLQLWAPTTNRNMTLAPVMCT